MKWKQKVTEVSDSSGLLLVVVVVMMMIVHLWFSFFAVFIARWAEHKIWCVISTRCTCEPGWPTNHTV